MILSTVFRLIEKTVGEKNKNKSKSIFEHHPPSTLSRNTPLNYTHLIEKFNYIILSTIFENINRSIFDLFHSKSFFIGSNGTSVLSLKDQHNNIVRPSLKHLTLPRSRVSFTSPVKIINRIHNKYTQSVLHLNVSGYRTAALLKRDYTYFLLRSEQKRCDRILRCYVPM